MEPTTDEQLLEIKRKALEILGPFGFEDCADSKVMLRHRAVGHVDISAIDPYKIITEVCRLSYDAGYNVAMNNVKAQISLLSETSY